MFALNEASQECRHILWLTYCDISLNIFTNNKNKTKQGCFLLHLGTVTDNSTTVIWRKASPRTLRRYVKVCRHTFVISYDWHKYCNWHGFHCFFQFSRQSLNVFHSILVVCCKKFQCRTEKVCCIVTVTGFRPCRTACLSNWYLFMQFIVFRSLSPTSLFWTWLFWWYCCSPGKMN